MENVIPTRIYEFLKQYPPFSFLDKEQLLKIAEHVVIQYVQPGEIIFEQGKPADYHIYVIREGAVNLFRKDGTGKVLLDECDEGDIFGIRTLLADQIYLGSAQAIEESLLFKIGTNILEPIMENEPKIAWYFAQTFASGAWNKNSTSQEKHFLFDQSKLVNPRMLLLEVQSIMHSKKPVCCKANQSVSEAARTMRDKQVGSIIVINDEELPIGIMTDRDLRNQIVTGDNPLDTEVGKVMSSPVITLSPDLTVADVQIAMTRFGVHHLCLTEDGTPQSKVVGIISEHDLLVIQGNNPAILIREIKRSQTGEELGKIREKAERLMYKYLIQEVSIEFISNIMTQVNDALIVRSIELVEKQLMKEGITPPDVEWCWMGLGSEGREEQLLRTDQDSALVYQDVPEEDDEKVKEYFTELAKRVTVIIREAGFEYCPAEMMASNPEWCLSMSQWKAQFTRWMSDPDEPHLLFAMIFFDFRALHGEFHLTDKLAEHIFETMDKSPLFLPFLARVALQNPPPLTFFRNFVVERGGEHKNQFDIKSRAMRPLADAARVLILYAKKPKINNTFRRFDYMAELEPQNKELFEQASDAYEILVRYRALQGLKNKNSGRFFNPEELSKMDRLNLKNSFQPISKLHDLLKVRFRIQMLI